MKRCLVTGAYGFVAQHLLRHLETLPQPCEVVAVGRAGAQAPRPAIDSARIRYHELDLLEQGKLEELIAGFAPEWVFHLASQSSVSHSWRDPIGSFVNNTHILLNLLEVVRSKCPSARVLSVGSSEEYGLVSDARLPLDETAELVPTSPYAVARISQEHLSKLYHRAYGIDVVLTRSFNHIGPGQSTRFAVPSFLSQLLLVKSGREPPVLRVGNVQVVRDFVDVRDVVRAYVLLMERGQAGDPYNVCSGTGVALRGLIDEACQVLGIQVCIEADAQRMRPLENPRIVGSYAKLERATGWAPRITLRQSLSDILEAMRASAASGCS